MYKLYCVFAITYILCIANKLVRYKLKREYINEVVDYTKVIAVKIDSLTIIAFLYVLSSITINVLALLEERKLNINIVIIMILFLILYFIRNVTYAYKDKSGTQILIDGDIVEGHKIQKKNIVCKINKNDETARFIVHNL